ncbi:TPA: hypothetical protein N0F65_008670, partial [Lagenidium giganteum]
VNKLKNTQWSSKHSVNNAFTFACQLDDIGNPIVGDGGDDNNALGFGINTEFSIRRLQQDPATFELHMDATNKTNRLTYPGFVMGISDICRTLSRSHSSFYHNKRTGITLKH